jgi:ribonuclease HII
MARWGRGERRPTTSAERILGVDEAGRGSVLGPLVVGAFCCTEDRLGALRETGVRDSKRLTPRRREEVYSLLPGVGECRSVSLTPRRIDRYVARGGLNELELVAFAELVSEFRPDVAYVDACDPVAERFGRRLEELAGSGIRIVSRHKADRDFPVVSAASVVAKVRRDGALAALCRASGETLGSGYPSDPETKACVARHVRDGGAVPTWMRRSWETVQRVKREHPARTLDGYHA